MIIWFGTTTAKWREYKRNYFMIRNYILELNCNINFDWLEEANSYYETEHKNRNIRKVYEKVTKAIDDADACIIEYTVPNFSSSHQINYALLRKKPTLIMRIRKDNPRFNDSYLEALQSPLLTIRDYNEKNYKQIMKEFIEYSNIDKEQQRYNIVLGKKQKCYLDWAAKKYQRSRSSIIRELIDRMLSEDKEYRKYRSQK
jgi:hypothetical protein